MTEQESYYDWKLGLRTKPSNRKKKKNKDITTNDLGISNDEFKKFIKLWRSKNISF
ncbi:MAG: hypothetical protein KAT57_10835 [Candidatus Lokiarchaeota archaeon]|nr:hypothetical protein [Candidatus Lokiarchaeota archaeon]